MSDTTANESLPTSAPTQRCPWCRVADVAVESMQCADRIVTGVDEDNGPVYWAECQRCGAQGPIVGWAADAIPKWNTRAQLPPDDVAKVRGFLEWIQAESSAVAATLGRDEFALSHVVAIETAAAEALAILERSK